MNAVKSYILENGLKSGDPLPTEAKLCETLGVSRSSVREALRKLEALDIVTTRQGCGSLSAKCQCSQWSKR
ncbi:FadR/GntR family transcriptional regulator [Arcanobacterium hippocoleae]|uniref:FadR/GntR family transcriptional regulator n=1 Tax=Arcanobacterium hippocoleae TaxID=149017 RepID=UPI00334095E4